MRINRSTTFNRPSRALELTTTNIGSQLSKAESSPNMPPRSGYMELKDGNENESTLVRPSSQRQPTTRRKCQKCGHDPTVEAASNRARPTQPNQPQAQIPRGTDRFGVTIPAPPLEHSPPSTTTHGGTDNKPHALHRRARVTPTNRPTALRHVISSPFSDQNVSYTTLPTHMTNSQHIHYHSPTESAAQTLFSAGISRPVIAQQNIISASERVQINQRLRERYPGDVPMPFGYRYQNVRGRSDGCWVGDGDREGGLDAGMQSKKSIVKRVVKKVKKTVGKLVKGKDK